MTLLDTLRRTADAVGDALRRVDDWGPSGLRAGQYRADLHADEAALAVLRGAGLAVLSEESGIGGTESLIAVLDPLDGSTNAAHGISWFATSICVFDDDGPLISLVRNQASGREYHAIRGEGAFCNGQRLGLGGTGCTELSDAIVALSGLPPRHLGWRQYRALGAAALDLCLVAEGGLDAFVDCSPDAHGVWDYCGALLVCREAGIPIVDAFDRDLVTLQHAARRTPIAASSEVLLDVLVQARQTW